MNEAIFRMCTMIFASIYLLFIWFLVKHFRSPYIAFLGVPLVLPFAYIFMYVLSRILP